MSDADIRALSSIESIRTRPAMYVGSTALFGLVNYLVCPIAYMLTNGAKRIDVTIDEGFGIATDIQISTEEQDGRILPFEFLGQFEGGLVILNALSSELTVAVHAEIGSDELRFQRGAFTSRSTVLDRVSSGTTLNFKPDTEILSVTNLSAFAFESYLKRLSFLHSGVQFSLTVAGTTQHFRQKRGITDLFSAISSPYQLMHEPIHFIAKEGALRLELVMAHHSWSDNRVWCFINNGRAVEGGTHEQGLLAGLKRLRSKLELPKHFNNGVIGVASIEYPGAVWQGCIKSKIGNPELKSMVARLVVDETMKWLEEHPSVESQIRDLQTFQFPEIWRS